jgi:hypothetical protein
MDIANKNRFPHIYQLGKLGGDKSAEGEAYYEEHETELSKEYAEIMKTVVVRDNFGGNKKIHEKEK